MASSHRHRRRPSPKPRTSPDALERLHPHAAGMDCGSAEHVFVLQQNLALFDTSQRQLTACDAAIEAHLAQLAATAAPPVTSPLPPARRRQKPRENEPRFDVRTPLHQLTGVDLSQIDGIGPYNALRVLAEIGTDMTRW